MANEPRSDARFWGSAVYKPLYTGLEVQASPHRDLGLPDPVRKLPRLREDDHYRFDWRLARRAETFVESLRLWEGEWAGQPLRLQPWQRRIIWDLFGWVRRDNGLRRFRTVYIEIPRKNGKSTFSAPIAAYMLMADLEPGAQVFSAAGSREQAAIVFKSTMTMLRAQPSLMKRIRLVPSERALYYPKTNSVYTALSSIAENKHGTNPHCVIYDELHIVKDRALYQALASGMGARRQPLFLMLTTAGFDRTSMCWEQHEYARAVLAGEIQNPEYYPVIYAADPNGDWTTERQWAKANPNYELTVKRDYLESRVRVALEQPSEQNEVKRLQLNIWTQTQERWLDVERWDQCLEEPAAPDNWPEPGTECWGGLDLSSHIDLTSLCLVWKEGDLYRLRWRHYIPAEGLVERCKRDKAPYDAWIRDGWLRTTVGERLDLEALRIELRQLAKTYKLIELAYDPWAATHLVQQLEAEDGITPVEIRQGFRSMTAPTKELEALIMGKGVRHNGDPVARWAVSNVTVITNVNADIRPVKTSKQSTGRVDPVVAAVMAIGRAMLVDNTKSVYESYEKMVF